MFDTKIAVVLRDDLAPWQSLNVTAFLAGGLVGQTNDLIGDPYMDKDGHHYNALIRQPIVVLIAKADLLSKVHRRAIERNVRCSAYVHAMFKTGHDTANRAAFASFGVEDGCLAGLALHAETKIVDKITKGARLHP